MADNQEAEFLRKTAATLRRIASNRTPKSPRLIEIAQHHEREADQIELAERVQTDAPT
jgi:hypothetical protein